MMQQTHETVPAVRLLQTSPAARDAMLILLFGALTAVSAQISLPTQPVPVTGQVFLVLLSGLLLGPRLGLMSQLLYLCIGFLGAPVFAGGKAGALTLLGPTGGYLLAFPLAAAVAGWWGTRTRSFGGLLAGVWAASLLILALGALWLGLGAYLVHWPEVPRSGSLAAALTFGLMRGALPFAAADGVKALLAALAARKANA